MSTESLPAVITANEITTSGYFESVGMFEAGQRMAKVFASAECVPDTFRGKIADCLIALDMAARLKANPIAVMQNLYIVHGKPAWSAQFLVACINKSGLFKTPLRYRFSGKEGSNDYGCVAWALDHSGETLESTKITMKMAADEGWTTKNGSKWKTMPEQMLRYRAATFFARAYCPELTMGMMTSDEVRDTYDVESVPALPGKSASATKLDNALAKNKPAEPEVVLDEEQEVDGEERDSSLA
jgi:hypothetical protein